MADESKYDSRDIARLLLKVTGDTEEAKKALEELSDEQKKFRKDVEGEGDKVTKELEKQQRNWGEYFGKINEGAKSVVTLLQKVAVGAVALGAVTQGPMIAGFRQFAKSSYEVRDAFARLNHEWELIKDTLGEEFWKAIRPLVKFVTDLAAGFNSLSPASKETFLALFRLAGIIGLVASAFLALSPILKMLLNVHMLPLTLAILGVWYAFKHWDDIKVIVKSVVDYIKEQVGGAIDKIKELWQTLTQTGGVSLDLSSLQLNAQPSMPGMKEAVSRVSKSFLGGDVVPFIEEQGAREIAKRSVETEKASKEPGWFTRLDKWLGKNVWGENEEAATNISDEESQEFEKFRQKWRTILDKQIVQPVVEESATVKSVDTKLSFEDWMKQQYGSKWIEQDISRTSPAWKKYESAKWSGVDTTEKQVGNQAETISKLEETNSWLSSIKDALMKTLSFGGTGVTGELIENAKKFFGTIPTSVDELMKATDELRDKYDEQSARSAAGMASKTDIKPLSEEETFGTFAWTKDYSGQNQRFKQFLVDLRETSQSAFKEGISAGLLDGIETGFKNAKGILANIGRSIMKVLTDTLAQSIVNVVSESFSQMNKKGGGGRDVISLILRGMGAIAGVGGNEAPSPEGGMMPVKYHFGSMVMSFLKRAHSGLSQDEGMIIAQTGEGMLSRTGMQALARSNLSTLNAGSANVGGTTANYLIVANDPRSFGDLLKRDPSIIHGMVGEAMQNNAELRRIMRDNL